MALISKKDVGKIPSGEGVRFGDDGENAQAVEVPSPQVPESSEASSPVPERMKAKKAEVVALTEGEKTGLGEELAQRESQDADGELSNQPHQDGASETWEKTGLGEELAQWEYEECEDEDEDEDGGPRRIRSHRYGAAESENEDSDEDEDEEWSISLKK